MRARSVVLRNVTVRYGNVTALSNVSLEVEPGELVSLLGPSGCGKTTLLRAIAGFVHLDSGEILIGGEPCTHLPPAKRELGMVFQDYALFPHMTVYKNVAFGLKMRGVESRQRGELVNKVLTLLGLQGMGDRYPRQLSGGQQQRVALARALVVEPYVLLLDEPLAALDKKLREEMQIELRSLQRRVGITTIFVTHDQEEALTLSDRIIIMDKGRIVQIGSPLDIYENPRSHFSGVFVGKSNVIRGKAISCRHGESICEIAGLGWVSVRPEVVVGKEAQFLLRPEKVRLFVDRPSFQGETNCVHAKVEHAVYLGMVTEYHLATDRGFRLVVAYLNVNRGAQRFEPGDWVWATWSPDDLVFIPERG